MRVVLACWGSYGDLFPYLGIAEELTSRGHVPVIATCAYHAEVVRARGFEFRPLRPDVDPNDTALIARVMDPKRGSEIVVREMTVPAVADQYEDLSAAADGADLLVSHPVTFAAPLVGEKRKMPWIATVLSPISFFSIDDFPVMAQLPRGVHLRRLGKWTSRVLLWAARRTTGAWTEPIQGFRARIGLPRGGHPLFEGQFSPHGTLALFSPIFGPPQADWPAETHATGFVFDNRALPMPPDVGAFLDAGEPPIVFTLGSSAVWSPGRFYEESAKAARLLRRRALLLVGKEENRPRETASSEIHVALTAPHDQIFPRAAAIVHHGGVGTTGQALRSGRPMLVVPYAHDQPDNAHRVANLGVARVCYPKRYTARHVASHLHALLDGRRYADRAADAGARIRAEHGADAAAEALASVGQAG